jgi:hypothetical protein
MVVQMCETFFNNMSPRSSMLAKPAFSNNRIALARVPTNQGETVTEFGLGRIHLSSVNEFRLDTMQSQSIVLTVSFLSLFSGLFQQ